MQKHKALAAALLCTLFAAAQSPEYRNFDLNEKAYPVTATAEEIQKNKAIILNEVKAKELIINQKDEIEHYLFYNAVILINDQSAIDRFNKVYIPISSPDDLITLKCRTTQPNGKSVELFKGDMKTISEDGEDYFILALEGLEKGSIIEYYYLKRIGVAYYSSESLANKYLVKKYTSKIISPENLVYAYKTYNGMPDAKDTTYNGKNFLTFTVNNLEPVPDEKYTTNRAKLLRFEAKMDYNTKNSSKKLFTYADIAKRIMNNYHEKMDGDEKIINKTYKKLKLEDMSSTDEKVFAIESYIKNELGYIEDPGNLTMAQCISKKGLSKFYKFKFFTLMLEKCGINYEVVCTSNKSDQPFDPEFETYGYLDETFFYISETKKYVLPDNLVCRYGDIPSAFTGQKGLFIKPLLIGDSYSATNAIKFIQPLDGKQNYDNMEADITVKPADGKVNMLLTRTLNGYPAMGERPYYHYYDETKRTNLLNDLLKLGMENAKVSLTTADNYDLKDFKKYNQPFVASGMVEATELVEKAGTNVIFKLGNCIGPQAELYQEEKRHFPIYNVYPHSYKRVLKVTIPDGYEVQGLEKLNMNIELKEGNDVTAYFRSTYTKEGNKIVVTVYESYDKDTYDKEVFEGYRKVINAAADFNKIALLFKKL